MLVRPAPHQSCSAKPSRRLGSWWKSAFATSARDPASPECASSSANGISMTAASAQPATRPEPSVSSRVARRGRSSLDTSARTAKNSVMTTSTWKLDDG